MQKYSVALSVAAFSITFALTGCSSGGPVVEDEAQAESAPSSTPSESPTPTPPPAEPGTRENPVPQGTLAKHSDASVWKYSVGATDTDAWPEISAANEFNEPAPEGSTYISVPVHIVTEDVEAMAEGGDPWASFTVDYVTAAGNSFGEQTCTGVLPAPGPLYEVGTMYGGAEADFLACAAVPTADIPGGAWKISSLMDASAAVFFAGP